MTIRTLVGGLAMLVLAACSGSQQLGQIAEYQAATPEYEADVHPLSQTRAGVTIAIDEITRPERVERLFGADLTRDGIVPVNVVVSNFSKQPVSVKPTDVLLSRGKEVIDPLSMEYVLATARRQGTVESAMFRQTVLAPGETYRGFMFFPAPAPKRGIAGFLNTLFADDESARIRVGVTNLESGERIVFGPFSLALLDDAGL
jgi:hypothetical protein